MSVVLKKVNGKDSISVVMPDENNIKVTGDFYLIQKGEPDVSFSVQIICRLTETDIKLEHDIIYIDPNYINDFDLDNEDIKSYFNTLIRIINFRMNIEIKNMDD